jgi:hypothetical protein
MGLIDHRKDVDGLTPANAGLLAIGRDGLRPCTPARCMALLAHAGVDLQGAEAVVVGRSNLFGKPMAQLLLAADASVTIAHSHTRHLPEICRRANVLIVAVGRDRMVKADWIKRHAVVLDVGMNGSGDGLNGDVEFAAALDVASRITPVPGGVGPMTIAMLLRNTVTAAMRLPCAPRAPSATRRSSRSAAALPHRGNQAHPVRSPPNRRRVRWDETTTRGAWMLPPPRAPRSSSPRAGGVRLVDEPAAGPRRLPVRRPRGHRQRLAVLRVLPRRRLRGRGRGGPGRCFRILLLRVQPGAERGRPQRRAGAASRAIAAGRLVDRFVP